VQVTKCQSTASADVSDAGAAVIRERSLISGGRGAQLPREQQARGEQNSLAENIR